MLLHDLVTAAADRSGDAPALTFGGKTLTYDRLMRQIDGFASGLVALGLGRAERVGIYLEKRFEHVIAAFGTAAAGGAFVPLNPLLKPDQVRYILQDCNVCVLITSIPRLPLLTAMLGACRDLRHVVLVDATEDLEGAPGYGVHRWRDVCDAAHREGHRVIDRDMTAILYTSGSTGRPKGVVLSHQNMVAGAKSVASYLENDSADTLLAALPLSFDAGFSQLTTAFHAGARVVLLNYLLPRDVINALARERVTGLTAVPPLYIQLSQLSWPETISEHLRYFANTGGHMPAETLRRLCGMLPRTKPFLMYGLTEAFRATYLPPHEAERRPDSIGKAIPNTEIYVLREDGTRCAPNEPGELVQRGALVAMGYWNDPEKTAERFRPLPPTLPGREYGLVLHETAVFSGDTVRQDEEGFFYFVGRRDEMIKTSGYRVSPTEIEEVLYGTQMIGEAAVFGVPHTILGQAIVAVVTPNADRPPDAEALLAVCRERLPIYMLPGHVEIREGPLPRNANGKIDRKALSGDFLEFFSATKA
jgi:acyl-CoA ligase (AMP-forming) (exosortase A-associated)